MTVLSSFTEPVRVAVVGASGGVGGALLQLLEGDTRVGELFAFARQVDAVSSHRATVEPLDLSDESSVAAAAERAAAQGELDLVIVATGLLHRDESIRPEKSLRELDPLALAQVLAVNTVGPALVAKHFLPRLCRGRKSVFAALSARVGSIGDNRLGGWASYRASKAALNQLLRTFAIEHARRFPDSVIAALHPGTVATDLSAPYTGRVPANKLFAPQESASYLLTVIDSLTPAQSGGFFAWDGAPITF